MFKPMLAAAGSKGLTAHLHIHWVTHEVHVDTETCAYAAQPGIGLGAHAA